MVTGRDKVLPGNHGRPESDLTQSPNILPDSIAIIVLLLLKWQVRPIYGRALSRVASNAFAIASAFG